MAFPLMAIPLIISAASAIGGAIGGANAKKKQQRMIDAEDQRNEDVYRNEFYKNQLDRTENAAALQKAHDYLKDRAKIDTKTAAVTGATPEAVAANRKTHLGAYSDLISKIAAQGSAARDRIQDRYEANKRNIFGMRMGAKQNQVNQYGNMTSNAINTGANSAMGLAGQLISNPSTKTSVAPKPFDLKSFGDATNPDDILKLRGN
ncbi:virion core protein, T7 gp14 family [Dysgonomonas termitidis]|uniref:Uncharacterized protein n=1 Tax=Dysgonomonas termitidis TaxID=1516126 RepID=A0ABV9L337_9BACT